MKSRRSLFNVLTVSAVVIQIGIVTSMFDGVAAAAQKKAVPADIAPINVPFDMPQLKSPVFADRVFKIVDHGAVQCKWEDTPKRKSTDAIAKAIKACHLPRIRRRQGADPERRLD